MAEKGKREQEAIYKKAEGTNISKILLVMGGIILIVAAIIGSYFLFQKKKEKEMPQSTISNVETFISYDSKSYIDVTNVNNVSGLWGIVEKEQQTDSELVKALFLTKEINTITEMLTTNDFFSLIKTTAPGALIRSLSDKYLLGKYLNQNAIKENDKSAIFLILETTDYSQAYSSMLDWEKTILKDLFVLFNIDISKLDNSFFEKPWKDLIINNKDARVLYGENGEGILYYVFVNKNNFVITSNIEVMREIISRMIIKNTKSL